MIFPDFYHMLIRIVVNAKLTGQKTYSDIMEACFGYKGRAAVAFIQFAMAFGGMCAFAVILGDTIPRRYRALAHGQSVSVPQTNPSLDRCSHVHSTRFRFHRRWRMAFLAPNSDQ